MSFWWKEWNVEKNEIKLNREKVGIKCTVADSLCQKTHASPQLCWNLADAAFLMQQKGFKNPETISLILCNNSKWPV